MSNYTLELLNSLNACPTYHASELKACVPNDPILFPSCKHTQQRPIITDDGLEEFLVNMCVNNIIWAIISRKKLSNSVISFSLEFLSVMEG